MNLFQGLIKVTVFIGIVLGIYWLVWLGYCYFAIKFNWPALGFWEFTLLLFLITTVGGWIFKSRK